MAILRVVVGRVLVLVAIVCIVAVGLTVLRVQATVSPLRATPAGVDFRAIGLTVREVSFPSADGVELHGWRLTGEAEKPPIVLCHDFGGSRESLLPLGIRLHEEGFPVLLFDFRGHGTSGGKGSTLGTAEKRDVLGAIDFARTMDDVEHARIGVYGLGMGAYAAVLAAEERPAAKVLVLEGLYPEPRFELLRRFYQGWLPDLPRAEFLPVGVFRAMNMADRNEPTADVVLDGLMGRDFLFLAPEGDAALTGEIERMYRLVPPQPDVDGNLLHVPGTRTGALFGAARERRDDDVSGFFSSRLLR